MQMALRTTFRPENAGRTHARYELRLGPVVIHAIVRNGAVTVGKGPLEKPDLIIESGPGIRAVMAQEISPADAVKANIVSLQGDPKLFARFGELFQI